MIQTVSDQEVFGKYLRTPEFALKLLDEGLKEEDATVFLLSLRDIIEANGKVSELSEPVKLGNANLYEALRCDHNPRMDTVVHALRLLGLRLTVTPLIDEEINGSIADNEESEDMPAAHTSLPVAA